MLKHSVISEEVGVLLIWIYASLLRVYIFLKMVLRKTAQSTLSTAPCRNYNEYFEFFCCKITRNYLKFSLSQKMFCFPT